ncbi:Fur family transcriptional regulator [Parapedobacter koreensis]|uniref:Fur family transcriptional regulator, ferric uptake regulator n=1 Tax=Parapedobacter koreensis TaxID=332977 RepID=A0A1H7ID20_9SPHI|nr:transcriptional repressor [Parapedobacter koreensis]SEK60396.1 Fur family transcriptional regulator, ferric uptake regulator [Parapedobacter koreensis]
MEDLAKLLRDHGLKATRLRLMILKILMGSRKSFSVPELGSRFRYQEDRVTIYRVLGDFHSHGLIERFVDIDGIGRYIYHPECSALHPHFRCRNCGTVQGLPELPESYMATMRDCLVEDAVLLFSGTCNDCLRRASDKAINRVP